MSDAFSDLEQQLQQAGAALQATTQLIDTALSALKSLTLDGERVSPAKLDEHQLASYELSLSWSECTAARFLTAHALQLAARSVSENTLTIQLSNLFCAEAITNTVNRLRARPADYGLTHADIITDPVAEEFLSKQLAAKNIAAIGQAIIDRDGDLGPDLLNEYHTIMRDTFRRFSDDVVAPLAESIHREDLIIPDAILEPLKEMGMFGLSIPAKYGGLQEDDKEDTLGMIVVTEELSRGSIGAAGSLITRPEILARALLKGGTEEQKQYWLPQLAVGDPLCAVAVTEPNYGSDVAGVRLKATATEGGWLLNGAKTCSVCLSQPNMEACRRTIKKTRSV